MKRIRKAKGLSLLGVMKPLFRFSVMYFFAACSSCSESLYRWLQVRVSLGAVKRILWSTPSRYGVRVSEAVFENTSVKAAYSSGSLSWISYRFSSSSRGCSSKRFFRSIASRATRERYLNSLPGRFRFMWNAGPLMRVMLVSFCGGSPRASS